MSAILNLTLTKPLDLLGEAYVEARTFLPSPYVILTSNFDRLLWLNFTSTKPIPNRKISYRNHYALYTYKTSLLLVWTETTLDYGKANDAVLNYYNIECQAEESLTNKISQWSVSYDHVSVSYKKPLNFTNYNLHSSGEWWYFDRGFILNGIVDSEYTFNYFEFHTTKPQEIITEKPFTFFPLNQNAFKPTNSPINIKQEKLQICFPSIYWFITRSIELSNNNITFFEPTSLC
jgi:hypothetical protein